MNIKSPFITIIPVLTGYLVCTSIPFNTTAALFAALVTMLVVRLVLILLFVPKSYLDVRKEAQQHLLKADWESFSRAKTLMPAFGLCVAAFALRYFGLAVEICYFIEVSIAIFGIQYVEEHFAIP